MSYPMLAASITDAGNGWYRLTLNNLTSARVTFECTKQDLEDLANACDEAILNVPH